MNLESAYQSFKQKVLNQKIGNGECVALVVNTPQAYVESLFPDIPWESIIAPLTPPNDGALFMAAKGNQYLTWVENDHNDPNQLPPVGAIMIFGATGPEASKTAPGGPYMNQFDNPYGHAGINDGADSNGYTLLQQNSPTLGAVVNVTHYVWKFRPCLGWYIPNLPQSKDSVLEPSEQTAPTQSGPVGKTLHIAQDNNPLHLYPEDGPYVPSNVMRMSTGAPCIVVPGLFEGGIDYIIVADKGNGVYVVDTEDYGRGALWTQGSDITIS